MRLISAPVVRALHLHVRERRRAARRSVRLQPEDGDLVSLDLAINVDGWVADSAISFCVGTQHPDDLRLIKCTEEALAAGIEAAQPGNRLGDVSCAVGDVAREYGYPINLEFGGHGVGHIMHGDPHVPNDGKAHHGYKLRPGLVIAIEPWFLKTTDEIYQDPKDGWTLRSEDGSRGAHSEHTIAITENGPVILTTRDSTGNRSSIAHGLYRAMPSPLGM